jgi:hypothetical protein
MMTEDIPDGTLSPDALHRWTGGGWERVVPPGEGDGPANQAPGEPASSTSETESNGRKLLIIGVVAAVVVIAGVVVGIIASNSSNTSKVKVHGSLTLTRGGGYTTSDPCYGTGNGLVDYSDLTPAAQVEVLDASGTVDGTSVLGSGTYSNDNTTLDTASGGFGPYTSCTFSLQVTLDHASPHYQLVIAQRAPFAFDDPTSLSLTLGFTHG